MQIEAAVVRQHGEFGIETVTLDELRPGEVLVRIVATGMCHTDLGVLDGHIPWPLPAIVGHEGAGIVERIGSDVSAVAEGDRVVISFASCGVCPRCAEGELAYCDAFVPLNFYGRRMDGSPTHRIGEEPVSAPFFYQSSFATYAIASERNVVKVDADLPLHVLAPLGCGVQTGAGAVFNRLKPPAGTGMVVFGMGAVGLSALLAGHVQGCSPLVAVDLSQTRLELARALGATHVLRGDDADLAGKLQEISAGGFHYSVEATGVAAVMVAAVAALRKRGEAILLGVAGQTAIPFGADILRGITIHSSIEGDSDPQVMIPKLIALYREGKFPFDRMIQTFPFDQINAAVAASKDGSVIKPVLLIGKE